MHILYKYFYSELLLVLKPWNENLFRLFVEMSTDICKHVSISDT